MANAVRHGLETLGGLWQLMLMGLRYRGRLKGRYWRWREMTAFGPDPDRIPSADRRQQILAYAIWVHRMKKRL